MHSFVEYATFGMCVPCTWCTAFKFVNCISVINIKITRFFPSSTMILKIISNEKLIFHVSVRVRALTLTSDLYARLANSNRISKVILSNSIEMVAKRVYYAIK